MSKRVCIYVRVSTTKQTVENQIQVLREYSDRCGYQITRIYSDNGISGSKGRQDRPGLDQMLKDGVQRKFEMVLVWSVDRLGRSVSHLVEVMNDLKIDKNKPITNEVRVHYEELTMLLEKYSVCVKGNFSK